MQYSAENTPLQHLDEWDEFVSTRYRQGKSEEEFRDYKADANPTVTEFYRQNHAHQTLDFVLSKKAEYCSLNREKKSIWEMAEYLNTVVDDSFPAGCGYSDQIVFPEFFAANPDSKIPEYQTEYGIYERNCGLDKVHLSFGHDEYIYQATRKYLPEEAQYMLRYHSFYPAHRHGAYRHLMNERDERLFEWVRKFNQYDLYSKGRARPKSQEILPYY